MPPLLWAEFPFQYLVPLVFLVIWIFNQIFGQEGKARQTARREVPPPQGRPNRGPSSPPARTSEPSMSWSERTKGGPPRGPAPPPGQDFLKIGPERDPSRPADRRARNAAKKQAKPRSTPEPIREVVSDDARSLGGADSPGLGEGIAPPTARTAQPTTAALIRSLRDPTRIREAIIMNEILQPPLALRGGSTGRIARHGPAVGTPVQD
jgi:hypothetical protein